MNRPGDNPDTLDVLTWEQYAELRHELWKKHRITRNMDRIVFTEAFAVETPKDGPDAYQDIIESVSPDIHVITISRRNGKDDFYRLYANTRRVSRAVDIATGELHRATEIHYAFVRKFRQLRSMRMAMDWLVIYSTYARMKGKDGRPLLTAGY